MPTQATYDDANLILRLFELRREEKLRQAREWFSMNFRPKSVEDVMSIAPPGSKENAYMRMVIGYWEMACSFVTSGVLNQDLFFESNGELLFVWECIREIVPAMRDLFKNPLAYQNLEKVGNEYIRRMQSAGPETYPAFQAMVRSISSGR